MRKILISLLIVLLLIVAYLATFKGINFLGLDVLSISGIKDKNDDLDRRLGKVSTLTGVDQPKAMTELNDSVKQLTITKEEYNDKVLYSSKENIENASQIRPYETEYLQTKIGNHAKDKSINLRYELRQATTNAVNDASQTTGKYYDMYFTLTGSYVSISEFIAAIENDSSLNFKIENFKIIPNEKDTNNLQATFNVKDVLVIVGQPNVATGNNVANSSTTTTTGKK